MESDKKNGPGRPNSMGGRYPWNRWFDCKEMEFTLVRGKDYRGRPDVMIQSVRGQASKRGLSVVIKVAEDCSTITVNYLVNNVG